MLLWHRWGFFNIFNIFASSALETTVSNLANSCLSSIQRQSNFWRSDVFLISIQYILLSEKSCFFKSIASSVSFHIFAMPVLRIAFWTCVSGAAFCWALVALDGILLWSAFSRDVIGRVCFLVGFNPLMVTLARREIRLPTNHWRIFCFLPGLYCFSLPDAKYFFNAYLQPCKYLIHSVLQSFAEEQKFVREDRLGTAFLQRNR